MAETYHDAFEEHTDSPKVNGHAQPIRFKLVSFADIKPKTDVRYVVKPIVPALGLTLVWGKPKCGKSFWVFDTLMHVALAWPYRGHKVKSGIVIYVALEGADGFKARIEAFRQHHKLSNKDVPFYLLSAPLDLVKDVTELIQAIRLQLGAETQVAAVAIDTLNRSLQGSESSDEDMSIYICAADALRHAFQSAVVIIHHCGHNSDRPRGHSALLGAIDAQIAVTRDAADNIIATLEVAKDGPSGETVISKLTQVEVGLDEDGDAITSCIVEAVEGKATPVTDKADRLSKPARIALEALQEAILTAGEPAQTSNHIPPGTRAVTMKLWRQYCYGRGVSTSDERRAKEMAFKRASETLLATKRVGTWNDLVWLC